MTTQDKMPDKIIAILTEYSKGGYNYSDTSWIDVANPFLSKQFKSKGVEYIRADLVKDKVPVVTKEEAQGALEWFGYVIKNYPATMKDYYQYDETIRRLLEAASK